MIVISTTVGVGFFVNSGDTMALAGPGATILAFVVVGLIAWGAMDGLGEMVVFWPVPNPLVQFVQTFVDRELGTVVHFAYWYKQNAMNVGCKLADNLIGTHMRFPQSPSLLPLVESSNIGLKAASRTYQKLSYLLRSQSSSSSSIARVSKFVSTFQTLSASVLPCLLTVQVFGYIELFGGSLKLFMVAGLALIMFLIDWGGMQRTRQTHHKEIRLTFTVGPAPKANLSSCT